MNIMVHAILINKIVRKTVAMFLLKNAQYRTQNLIWKNLASHTVKLFGGHSVHCTCDVLLIDV